MTLLNRLQTLYYTQQLNRLSQQLAAQPFWWVDDLQASTHLLLYDNTTRLLWDANPDQNFQYCALDEGKNYVKSVILAGLNDWRLPTQQELWGIAGSKGFPLKLGSNRRIQAICHWLCDQGCIDMDVNTLQHSNCPGHIFCCNNKAVSLTPQAFLEFCLAQQWTLQPCDKNAAPLPLQSLSSASLTEWYRDVDYLRARLPVLEDAQFTDPAKGLWEFWNMEEAAAEHLRARNPALDVRDWNVAIDFGTSSTVVAYTENGQAKLLRIGVDDFWKRQAPEHYENPTVLEFVDFPAFLDAWRSEAYQPLVLWDDVRCSHEALHNLRNNETDSAVVASILGKIKQWALRADKDARTRITDRQHGHEHELAPLSLLQPVKGEALTINPDYPFDPIELYAWFLGLTINWRGRGLFLRYYMTFPIAYPSEVKQKILASFRRGLQRSLPATLVGQAPWSQFTVEERASEPAAYAAAALPELGIAPTVEGVAYAVFDFGGGTADFDFGYYRLPGAEEEENGIEIVLEHFGASGDRFLGGENLLENMAYRVFLHNLDMCRNNKIAFSRPLDADDFPGSEMFLEKTQAALTNSLMLMSRLRPLWENGEAGFGSGVEKMQLMNRDGEKVNCEFEIPVPLLQDYLKHRIEQGIHNFFAALKQAFGNRVPAAIQVLLAGNASRSMIVQTLLGIRPAETDAADAGALDYLETLYGADAPTLNVHAPLPMDANDVYRPTGKTGVALGLLRLCPGSSVNVINRAIESGMGEAPFAFYVGRIRAQVFHSVLKQGGVYGQWCEFGPIREGVFNLVYTQSPKAGTGEMRDGEAGLIYKRLDLRGCVSGKKLFARITGTGKIQLCSATNLNEVQTGVPDNEQELSLN